MPTFTLEAPDGRKVRIEAADQATAMRGAQEWYASQRPSKPSIGKDVGKSAATGVGKGVRNTLAAVFSGSPQGMASNALGALGASEGLRGAFETASPLGMLRNAENVLGLASGTTRKAVEKAPSRDYVPETRAGRYAEAGGENAANILAPGGIPARVASIVVPSVTGEAAREAASALGAGPRVQAVAKLVGNLAGGALTSLRVAPTPRAQAPAAKFGQRAKLDPAQMRAKAEEMRAAGVEPTLVDVAGPKGRRVIRAVGVKSEAAGETLTNRANEVSSSAKPDIMVRTREVGPMQGKTADELVEMLLDARKQNATTNYAGPYQTPVKLTEDILKALSGEPGRAALQRARAAAVARMDDARVQEIDALLTGQADTVTAATLDRSQIAMRERGEVATRRNAGDLASGYETRRGMINKALDEVPELGAARQDYRDKSSALGVLDRPGKQSARLDPFSTDPADYDRWMGTLPREAQEANAVALRQDILDALGKGKATSFGTVDQLATSPYAQQNLARALGPEGARLLDFVRARIDQVRNARFVDSEAGSRTAVVNEDLQRLGTVLKEGAGAAVEAKTGNLPMLMARGANWLASRGFNDQQAQALTEMAVDPRRTDEAIRIIAQRLGPEAARSAIEWRRAAMIAAGSTATALQGQQ